MAQAITFRAFGAGKQSFDTVSELCLTTGGEAVTNSATPLRGWLSTCWSASMVNHIFEFPHTWCGMVSIQPLPWVGLPSFDTANHR